MKYLNLSAEDRTLMKMLTRKKILPYVVSFIVVLFVIFVGYSQVVKNRNLNLMPTSSFLIFSAMLVLSLFFLHFLYTTGLIKTILQKNQKVVYSGALSDKKIKGNPSQKRYVFYMDGMKFSVKESDFESYNIGESIEFHVSRTGKHLIKISRPF
jgi:hypothetical protein